SVAVGPVVVSLAGEEAEREGRAGRLSGQHPHRDDTLSGDEPDVERLRGLDRVERGNAFETVRRDRRLVATRVGGRRSNLSRRLCTRVRSVEARIRESTRRSGCGDGYRDNCHDRHDDSEQRESRGEHATSFRWESRPILILRIYASER